MNPPLLLFLVGDVQRGDQRAGGIARTEDRDADRQQQPEAFLAAGGLHDVHQLLSDDLRRILRHDAGQRPHVAQHSVRVRDDAVRQDDRTKQRNEREETVKGDARRDERDIVLGRLLPRPQRHLLPAKRRHVERRVCVPAGMSATVRLR